MKVCNLKETKEIRPVTIHNTVFSNLTVNLKDANLTMLPLSNTSDGMLDSRNVKMDPFRQVKLINENMVITEICWIFYLQELQLTTVQLLTDVA